MVEKEEESDYSSLNIYFIDDDLIKRDEPEKVKTITEDVSISISSSHYEDNSDEEIITTKTKEKIEKKGCPHKIKYLKSITDDSLTTDICKSVNKDWKK